MTFNTGNPVGSTDARDLYDNAQNLDKFANGPDLEYPDRLGTPRKSLAGLRQDVQDALSRLGHQIKGDYAAGLLIENYGEVFRKDGEFYRAKAELALPYELTGNWGVEEALFVSVGDAVLREELSEDGGAGRVGFSSAISYLAGSIGRVVRDLFVNATFVTPESFDAVGDGIADDSTSIENWLASGKPLTTGRGKIYRITRGLKIPTRTVLRGVGESTQFKWDGGNGASPSSKTIIFDVSSSDPLTVALANVIIEDIHLDLNNAENVIGWNWEYASVKSRGCGLNAYNLGANSTGFRFRKEWYATFRDLSVRNSAVVAGTVGYDLSTSSSLGQINRVRMENFQTNRIDVGMLIDTRANYIYGLYVSGEFELGRIGIQHLGGLGVRQGEFNVYLESNTESDVSWGATAGGAGTDVTGEILWAACAFHANSKLTIAEGNHTFISCNQIGTLNQSGGRALVNGSPSMVKNITGGTLRHIPTVVGMPTKLAYAAADAYPLAGETTTATLASATTSAVFSVPAGLLATTMPAVGRVLRVSAFGRRTYNPVEKYWEGFLSQKADGTWALTKFTHSSADDAIWSVVVDTSTGALTVNFTAGDQKVVGVTWMPA